MAEDIGSTEGSRVDFGVAVVDKPAGITSNGVLSRVRRIARNKRAGHSGTLDPFATGVLVVAVGRATRLFPLLHSGPKRYGALISLGAATDTADLTGEVIADSPVPPFSDADLEEVAATMRGRQLQVPPAYSAKKVAGVPSHVLARQGRAVELAAVEIEVFAMSLERVVAPQGELIAMEVECSRGSYVRTLAEEVARRLGTLGHLVQLRRLQSDGFDIESAVPLEDFSAQSFLPLEVVLGNFAIAFISADTLARARHGHEIPLGEIASGTVEAERHVAIFVERAATSALASGDLVGIYRLGSQGALVAEMLFVA